VPGQQVLPCLLLLGWALGMQLCQAGLLLPLPCLLLGRDWRPRRLLAWHLLQVPPLLQVLLACVYGGGVFEEGLLPRARLQALHPPLLMTRCQQQG
jgi:hypothetical protein